MLLTWTPADAEPREFVFRPDDLPPHEYEPIELAGYWPSLDVFVAACMASQRTAWRIALWICLRRDDPDLELADVQPRPLDLSLTFEPEEELALAEQTLQDPDATPGLRALIEANMPAIRAAAEAAAAGKADGPAASPTNAGPGSGTSRGTAGSGGTSRSRRASSAPRSPGSTTSRA